MRPAAAALLFALFGASPALSAGHVLYPAEGSVFPTDIAPLTFVWQDDGTRAVSWLAEVPFGDGSSSRHQTRGDKMQVGEFDPRCMGPTNELPELRPEEQGARTWIPDAATWAALKKRSVAQPEDFTLLNQIAWVQATSPDAELRNGAAAVELSAKAVRLSGGEPEFLDTLAAAYAEAGNYNAAERALALSQTAGKPALAERLKSRLALYRGNTPFREAAKAPRAGAAR